MEIIDMPSGMYEYLQYKKMYEQSLIEAEKAEKKKRKQEFEDFEKKLQLAKEYGVPVVIQF